MEHGHNINFVEETAAFRLKESVDLNEQIYELNIDYRLLLFY